MEEYSYQELLLNPDLHKYSRYYFDFLNKKLINNSTVLYIQDNSFLRGYTVLKDLIVTHKDKQIKLLNLPHISTIKGVSIPSDGTNCVLIQ